MKRLAILLLCAIPAYANEPPYPPVASCDDEICTMTKADFEKFREFHIAVQESMDFMSRMIDTQNREIEDLTTKLNRAPFCRMKSI